MTDPLDDLPKLEPGEAARFDAWNAAHDLAALEKPKSKDMASAVASAAARLASSARASFAAYGQPIDDDVARQVVALEAAERLILRVRAQIANWPRSVQMALRE